MWKKACAVFAERELPWCLGQLPQDIHSHRSGFWADTAAGHPLCPAVRRTGRQLRPRRGLAAAIPGRAFLRRQVTQGLTIGLYSPLERIIQRVVRHQQVIRGGKTPVTLGAQALEAGFLAVVFGQTGRLGLGGSLFQTGLFGPANVL